MRFLVLVLVAVAFAITSCAEDSGTNTSEDEPQRQLLGIEEVQGVVGFSPILPAYVPAGLTLFEPLTPGSVELDPPAVQLTYTSDGTTESSIDGLWVFQGELSENDKNRYEETILIENVETTISGPQLIADLPTISLYWHANERDVQITVAGKPDVTYEVVRSEALKIAESMID